MIDSKVINDFSGGLYTDEPPFKIGPNQFRTLKNVTVSDGGSLRLRTGQHAIMPTISGGPITGFTRFRVRGISVLPSGLPADRSFIVYGQDGETFYFDEVSGDTVRIDPFFAARELERFDGYVIYTTRTPDDTSPGAAIMRAWYGESADLPPGSNEAFNSAPAQGFVPSSPNVATISGAGNLDTTDLDPIQYITAFYETEREIEGNPGPLLDLNIETRAGSALQWSLPVSGAGFSTTVTVPTASAFSRRVYRRGGRLAVPRLVKDIDDFTTTEFHDNLSDLDVLGNKILEYYNDPGFGVVVAKMRDRLVSAWNTTVYVHTRGNPRECPEVVTDPFNDGIRFVLDGDAMNPIRAAVEFGGSCMIHRAKNLYIVQGDDYNSMTCQKVLDIGIIAGRTAKSCDGLYCWLAPDGMVWATGDAGLIKLGAQIEETLDEIPKELLPYANAAYYKNSYLLCIPNPYGTPYFFRFDFLKEHWTDLSYPYMNSTQMYADTGKGDLDEILFATTSGYTGVDGLPYNGIISALGDNDRLEVDFDAMSGDMDCGTPRKLKRFAHFRALGTLTEPATLPRLTVYATKMNRNGTMVVSSKTYELNVTQDGLLFEGDIDASIVGQYLAWRMHGEATYFELNEVEIFYEHVEDGNP